MKQVSKLFKPVRLIFIFRLLICTLFTVFSCTEDVSNFTIGKDFIESDTRVQLIDTFSVALSTVVFDSVQTSGSGTLLCGLNSDSISGNTYCQPYFQLGFPTIAMEDDEVYESTVLFLNYSDYFYGDTLKNQVIYVKKLTSEIKTPDDGKYYNSSTIAFDDTPIGTRTFTPRPGNGDTLKINIDNSIGQDLFDKMVSSSDIYNSAEGFVQYFNGLTIVPDRSVNSVILGFTATSSALYMVVYSHRASTPTTTISRIFPFINSNLQFNHIESDRTATPFGAIHNQRSDIPVSQTNQLSMTQGLLGILTKVRFPSLGEVQLLNKSIILRALLVLKPEPGTYTAQTLPDSLVLYNTNRTNAFVSAIYNNDNTVKVGEFRMDGLYNENTSYTFDITDFIKEEFADNYFDDEHGILVTIPEDAFFSTFDRVVLSGKTLKPQLKLYLLSY